MARVTRRMDKFAMPPDAIARAIAFAIEQSADVDVGETVVRPTGQGELGLIGASSRSVPDNAAELM
jgi:NADP-dependent 3-hydroxy acid dehydrogenase YdfG